MSSPCLETGHGQVAGSHKGRGGVVGIFAKADVELRVERVAEEKFDGDFSVLELLRDALEGFFILIGGSANRELDAELLCELPLQAKDRLVVEGFVFFREAHQPAKLILGGGLHADKKPALIVRTAGPFFNKIGHGFPTAQIEIANAKVGAMGYAK